MKKITIFILAILLLSTPSLALARGSIGGGGRSSFSGSSRVSSSTRSTTRTAPAKPRTAAQIKADKVQAAKQKAQETKYQKAADKQPQTKTINGKTYTKGQTVGVNGYNSPQFRGGYSAPPGSVVYYQHGSSAWDWFPMYYIMSHNGDQQAVVKSPDGKEKQVQEEGTDGMYFFNWFLVIVFGLGVIALIVYFVNRATRRNDYAY